MKHLLYILIGIAVVGCHDLAEPDTQTRAQELTSDNPSEAPARKAANALERAQKLAWSEGQPIEQVVDWQAADAYPAMQATLASDAAQTLATASLPVLLPDDATLTHDVFVTTGPTWYTARMQGDGVVVFVKGNRAAFVHGLTLTPEERAQLSQFNVSRTHMILSLSTQSFGVAYSIDVECARPTGDQRCEEDAYILGLADSLRRAGGQP